MTLMIRYCFSIATDPLNLIGSSSEEIHTLSKNISYKEKDLKQDKMLKMLQYFLMIKIFLQKTIIAKFEVLENFYSDLTRIKTG